MKAVHQAQVYIFLSRDTTLTTMPNVCLYERQCKDGQWTFLDVDKEWDDELHDKPMAL